MFERKFEKVPIEHALDSLLLDNYPAAGAVWIRDGASHLEIGGIVLDAHQQDALFHQIFAFGARPHVHDTDIARQDLAQPAVE